MPLAGLSVARQISMVLCRTPKGYQTKFGRSKDSTGTFQAKKYLDYQVTLSADSSAINSLRISLR